MNRTRCLQVVASALTVCCIVGVESGPAQQPSSNSKNSQAKTQSVYKSSRDYVSLASEKKSEVRVQAEKFYGTSNLPQFEAHAVKAEHVGKGVINFEARDHSELQLDVDPCHASMELYHDPYEKTELQETITCKGKEYTYYSITQKEKKKR